MVRLIFIDPQGHEHEVGAEAGQSVMEAAVSAMVPGIEAACGGNCVCATCHCHLDAATRARLPAPEELELAMLEGVVNPGPDSRLTCQVRVCAELDGARIRVADSQH
jgi:2Fe-2S ferredoxin